VPGALIGMPKLLEHGMREVPVLGTWEGSQWVRSIELKLEGYLRSLELELQVDLSRVVLRT
jgi:hypothetical protein